LVKSVVPYRPPAPELRRHALERSVRVMVVASSSRTGHSVRRQQSPRALPITHIV